MPDGALESLSFAALPDPAVACAEARPLVVTHEIAYLPSAAVLATQRRVLAGRRPAPGWLAVVADPVYESGDPRLPTGAHDRGRRAPRAPAAPSPSGAFCNAGPEATAILSGLPAGKTYRADGFGADKAMVLSGALAGYRVLHFATHGRLEPDRPQLSFLALSEFDAQGRPADDGGSLYAHEIYDLDLPAELVVLSACETALGREVRGEGLVSGLPRAFLHAGAARVLVSLWEVGDPSTRGADDLFLPRSDRERTLSRPRPPRGADDALASRPAALPVGSVRSPGRSPPAPAVRPLTHPRHRRWDWQKTWAASTAAAPTDPTRPDKEMAMIRNLQITIVEAPAAASRPGATTLLGAARGATTALGNP